MMRRIRTFAERSYWKSLAGDDAGRPFETTVVHRFPCLVASDYSSAFRSETINAFRSWSWHNDHCPVAMFFTVPDVEDYFDVLGFHAGLVIDGLDDPADVEEVLFATDGETHPASIYDLSQRFIVVPEDGSWLVIADRDADLTLYGFTDDAAKLAFMAVEPVPWAFDTLENAAGHAKGFMKYDLQLVASAESTPKMLYAFSILQGSPLANLFFALLGMGVLYEVRAPGWPWFAAAGIALLTWTCIVRQEIRIEGSIVTMWRSVFGLRLGPRKTLDTRGGIEAIVSVSLPRKGQPRTVRRIAFREKGRIVARTVPLDSRTERALLVGLVDGAGLTVPTVVIGGVRGQTTEPMRPAPADVHELRRRLIELFDTQPQSKGGLKRWYAKSQEADDFAISKSLGMYLPEIFWHWLADADIRTREPDSGYTHIQNTQMQELIGLLGTGYPPEGGWCVSDVTLEE